MNSKQRRKDKRRWKYRVSLVEKFYDTGVSKEQYETMWNWCVKQFGNSGPLRWREKHGYYGNFWQFDNEKDAAIFALKWV